MKPVFRILRRLVPGDWLHVIRMLVRLKAVSRMQTSALALLAFLSVASEAFGLFMILPILQFISNDRSLEKLAGGSRIWAKVAEISAWSGFPVTLFSLSAIVFILVCFRQVTQYYSTVYLARVQENVSRGFRVRTLRAILQSRGSHLSNIGSGPFVHVISTLCHYAGTAVGSIAKLGLILLSFLAYGTGLFLVAPAVTLIVGAAALGLGYMMRHFRLVAEKVSGKLAVQNEEMLQFLAERYQGWRLVRLSDSTEEEVAQFEKIARKIGALIVELARMSSMIQLLLNPIATAAMLVGLYISVEYFAFTVAEITLFVLVYLRVMPLMTVLISGRQQLVTVSVNLTRGMQRFDEAETEKELDTGKREFTGIRDKIVFDNVSYRYDDQSDFSALSNVNLTIPAHSITAITGPSGAGKSTLVDLLPRVLIPQSGRVLVDGSDLGEFKLSSLRRSIAFVPQTPILFGSTIGDNVRYGNADATNDMFVEACEMAFVDEFVSALPGGYETRVGEGGFTLSGGQRQRIALARAFLAGGSILVLDEPTSALDHESEERIKNAVQLYVERHGAVVIIIAHRLSTIENADHRIELLNGKVVKQTTRKSLHEEVSGKSNPT